MEQTVSKHKGLLALSPLMVFLCVYLISSIAADDFYAVPMSFSFLIASIYALFTTTGISFKERFKTFGKGAAQKNILLMVGIFVLAGAFAKTADTMGAIKAIVDASLSILPGNLIFAGLFLASCFISMAIGTSVGTIVALAPIAKEIAVQLSAAGATGFSADASFITAIIVGGAFFGDNLSFISDTTIASTRTQGCSMSDKFKVNLGIVAPAALIVTIIYMIFGADTTLASGPHTIEGTEKINYILMIPYLMIIFLAITGMRVLYVLIIGLLSNLVIGLVTGALDLNGFFLSSLEGIISMCDLIAVTLLAGGMLELIRLNGGLDYIVNLITQRVKTKKGAEFSIVGLVSFANICTANNTIAIISVGRIAKDISTKFGIDPRKTASILDTASCLIQGVLPYGAQLLMASKLAETSPGSLIPYLFYPMAVGLCLTASIILRLPRKYS